jgi:hypothetical protein
MALTATVRFDSSQSLEEIFACAQAIAETPSPEKVTPIITQWKHYRTISNPSAIGAKALVWATEFHPSVALALGNRYQVCFDIPYGSDSNVSAMVTGLIKGLGLNLWRYNFDMDDEWHNNQFPE